MRPIVTDAWARRLFVLSLVLAALAYGVAAGLNSLFPAPQALSGMNALSQLLEAVGLRQPYYFLNSRETQPVRILAANAMSPGLTLVSGLAADRSTTVKILDPEGRVVHSWRITWDEMWPNPTHLSGEELPGSNPALVHGVMLMPNADLVFNFESRGMVRLNPCGKVVWRLPYRTHHSVHLDEQGHFWMPGLRTRHARVPSLPNYNPPFEDYTVLEVSPDGRILQELSVFDLLLENRLSGLLYMSNRGSSTLVSGDTLHVNDVETFPTTIAPGAFEAGDVMISLRNINTVLVFGPRSRRIKFMTVGRVLRQHDPDFVDGNTISVFDNNTRGTRQEPAGHYSRIVTISATDGEQVHVRFEGTVERPLFTYVMGKHQNLPNGNMLVTEAMGGRVLEIDAGGRIVWQYVNLVRDGVVGLVSDGIRLPPEVDAAVFARAVSACRSASAVPDGGSVLASHNNLHTP